MRPFSDPAARRGDLTIFHYALPSPMTAAFASLDRGRVLQYHNVTPAAVFRAVRSGALPPRGARRAQELATLVGRVDLALGDLGVQPAGARGARLRADRRACRSPSTLARITQPAERPALERLLDDELVNFLFVGRIAPNKKIEDHIRLAEHYKRYVDAYYRFIFVGRYDAVPRYYATIRALMTEYRLLERSLRLHRSGSRRGARRLLPPRGRLHLAERARRLLRAAGRGDGRRRAGPRLRRRRRARRRSAAPACSSRRRISSTPPSCSARSPSTTTCAPASSPASAAGWRTSATRASRASSTVAAASTLS